MKRYLREKSCRLWIGIILLLLLTVASIKESQNVAIKSRSEIVSELSELAKKIATIEDSAKSGTRVFTASQTQQLINLNQAIAERLQYLQEGRVDDSQSSQWAGYQLEGESAEPYTKEQAAVILKRLQQKGLAKDFLNQIRIFLLPYRIPEIAGLGGAGFVLVSAAESPLVSQVADLDVTLTHEIGHNLHLITMPRNDARGRDLWNKYHQIRGGKWQGPGLVNTKAWSDSSEETFAEDFRLIFGDNQQAYGDIALGDPRETAGLAPKIKQFMLQLTGQRRINYKSPWLPNQAVYFWRSQPGFVMLSWVILGGGLWLGNYKAHQGRKIQQIGRPISI